MRASGGGGVTILIDPTSLRRAASRLHDVAGELTSVAGTVVCPALPEMPPGLAPAVAGRLSDLGRTLATAQKTIADSSVELIRRAFWTEIADELITGTPLGAAQLAQFKAWLRDGSLVRYAEPWQAELAGRYVGTLYRGHIDDPRQLVELSDILRRSAADVDFSVGFVQGFGAANLAHVPRVIQSMEWGQALSLFGPGTDPYQDGSLGVRLATEGYRLDRDPRALLSTFAMALAVATSSGRVDRDEEEELAAQPDHWAVAQLLANDERFGTTFLQQVFRHEVVDEIVREGPGQLSFGVPTSYAPIGGKFGHPLPTDVKTIALEAIARNGDAAAAVLSQPLPHAVFVMSPWERRETADPIDILYRFGNWSDDGRAVAHVYAAAVDRLHEQLDGQRLDAVTRANSITKAFAEQTLHAPHALGAVTDALAQDLAAHHMPSLYDAAGAMNGGDHIWLAPPEDGARLDMGVRALRDLMVKFEDRPAAAHAFFTAAAREQAELILANTHAPPTPETSAWTVKVGAFNTVLMNAHDVRLGDRFDARNAQHQLVFSFLHAVAGDVAKAVPGGELIAGPALDALDHATAPSAAALAAQQGDVNSVVINGMHAAIANGYYANGLIPRDGVPEAILAHPGDAHSPLKPYSSLETDPQIGEYNSWMNEAPPVLKLTAETSQTLGSTMVNVQNELQ